MKVVETVGNKKARKAKFLQDHPICCFCGGSTSAQEPDHIPSRAFFNNRQWPEGFEFPACVKCNRSSSRDEQIVALLARLKNGDESELEARESLKMMEGIGRFQPEVLLELKSSARQRRSAAQKYSLLPEGGSYAELPLIAVGPLCKKAMENFARKLFCALYYKHAERVLTAKSGIAITWWTNLQIIADEIPRELAPILSNLPELKRCNRVLNDQFFYRWTTVEDHGIAIFLAFFRESFALVGYIQEDAAEFPDEVGSTIIRPLSPR
ncbi:hypothetical protein CWI75_02915 [Kineobactrum sediminis]|uniref:HNH endonuclease n=1 Tax=Kineobactrum sediminis TaxID=1905677 RepID=A0A2N5Y7F3_9GAMM|nr:hypothetical protein [Kineobactrum sediminis]PLW84307.1 hypothetical protein CWI75_02915 [Kineobactrum sediminis]